MKTLLTYLGLTVLTLTPASAQEKLWTWKANSLPGKRTMEAVAMHKDGSGAFILGVTAPNAWAYHLLVMMSARGKVLLAQPIYPEKNAKTLGDESGNYSFWDLTFTGPGKLVARNGSVVRLYSATLTGAKMVRMFSAPNMWLINSSNFGGWIDYKGGPYQVPRTPESGTPGTSDYIPETPAVLEENIDTVTAWKF
jgi:hypothetical protein